MRWLQRELESCGAGGKNIVPVLSRRAHFCATEQRPRRLGGAGRFEELSRERLRPAVPRIESGRLYVAEALTRSVQRAHVCLGGIRRAECANRPQLPEPPSLRIVEVRL